VCFKWKSHKDYPKDELSSWNNIISYFILLEIRPLPLPSPKERVIVLWVEEVFNEIIGYYLFPITYHVMVDKKQVNLQLRQMDQERQINLALMRLFIRIKSVKSA